MRRTNGRTEPDPPYHSNGRDARPRGSHFTFFRRRLFFVFPRTPHFMKSPCAAYRRTSGRTEPDPPYPIRVNSRPFAVQEIFLFNLHPPPRFLGGLCALPPAMLISAAPCFSKFAKARPALAVQYLPRRWRQAGAAGRHALPVFPAAAASPHFHNENF
jgi:hypothetical protein